ncbi:MAG: cytidine deaminase [Candidatus Coatesbacteria bacterium]|nr:cytidine deaminase [Candidatus Coatesbacteria bacterium]
MISEEIKNRLISEAKKVSQNAYSPYSSFQVGAAILTIDGEVFAGCNVENSSYGLTSCAERNAVFRAISEGKREFTAIAIYTPTEKLTFPCGACRQVLIEFAENMIMILASDKNEAIFNLKELLPNGFSMDKE